MGPIVRIDLLVTHHVWCPHCQANTAHTTTGIGSYRGLALPPRDYAVTSCTDCGRAWSSNTELVYPPGHPSLRAPA